MSSRKHSRGSVSASATFYKRIRSAADARGVSMSSIVEGALADMPAGQLPTARIIEHGEADLIDTKPAPVTPRIARGQEVVRDMLAVSMEPLQRYPHNHVTRDIKHEGMGCPGCDDYHQRRTIIFTDDHIPRTVSDLRIERAIILALDVASASAPPEAHTFTCAVCASSSHGVPSREPFGRGGALVNVCATCCDEPPIEKTGPRAQSQPDA
jgi:hypothetical protein